MKTTSGQSWQRLIVTPSGANSQEMRTTRWLTFAPAIRAYRGLYQPGAGGTVWIHHPQKSAKVRVESWLVKLKMDNRAVAQSMAEIDAFGSLKQMRDWLNRL